MRIVTLLNEPNQRLGFQLDDGTNVNITIKTANNLTLFSISTDFEELIDSAICFPNSFVETFKTISGRFYWQCQDNNYPTYTQFGKLHNLYYLSPEEYQEVING